MGVSFEGTLLEMSVDLSHLSYHPQAFLPSGALHRHVLGPSLGQASP